MRYAVFLVNIRDSYKERLCQLVPELRSKTEIAQTFSSCDRKPLAFSCDIKAVDTR